MIDIVFAVTGDDNIVLVIVGVLVACRSVVTMGIYIVGRFIFAK